MAFPITEKPFSGGTVSMVISLHGVLNRAAETCRKSRDNKHLEFPLMQLGKHIEYMRASESDEQAAQRLEEFLRLWVN